MRMFRCANDFSDGCHKTALPRGVTEEDAVLADVTGSGQANSLPCPIHADAVIIVELIERGTSE